MKFLVKIDPKRSSIGGDSYPMKGSILTPDEHIGHSASSIYHHDNSNSILHRSHSVAPGNLKLQKIRPNLEVATSSYVNENNNYWQSVSS